MKLQNGLQIVSMEQQIGSVRLKAGFSAADIAASEKLPEKLKSASQWFKDSSKNDNFNFEKVSDVLPKDEDYIFVNFRALSKTTVPGHWIDWSKDDVLKNSVPKLLGATVYPNHNFTDINNWLGSVQNVGWDEGGQNSGGVAGINATYKIDALMNPRIARGLMMDPPAIHSTSMTVLFKFEPSHPDIFNENRWRFFELLGEEVEGGIVRFVVTEILEYWEASLVFQGADRLAKKYEESGEDETDESFEKKSAASFSTLPTNSNEEKTMKLSKEQKATLGIEFDGEDVPETEILKAAETFAAQSKQFDGVNLSELQAKAAVADTYVEEKRAEVVRLARIAELGADEGELDEVVSQTIEDANFERLQGLAKYYEKKAADKFPTGRSSQESSDGVEAAGGVKTESQKPKVSVGGLV